MYGQNTFTEGYMVGRDSNVGTCNSGWGNGDNAWWLIVLLIFGWGGFGNGFGRGGYGYGNGSGSVQENYVLTSDMSQLSRQIADTTAMTERKLDSITNGLCDGFYTNAQLINGVNSNIANAQYNVTNAITTGGYETRNAINGLGTQLATHYSNMRYDNAMQMNGLSQNISNGFCQTNFNNSNNTRDIITSTHSDTDRVLARLDAMENSRKDEKIAQQATEIASLQNQISMAGWSRQIVNEVRPCPVPAYITCNPYGCNCNCNQNTCC